MADKKILVAYATNSGSTAEAARMVAEELGKDGTTIDLRRVEDAHELEGYTAVVVGGPMIMGWHRAALGFLRRNQGILSHKQVAYFFTARSLTGLNETQVRGIPVSIDPTLTQAPKDPHKLTFRERYATVPNYLRPALNAAARVKPVSVAFAGGVLSMSNLKWWQTIFVLLIVQAKPGGRHNEEFLRTWADEIKPKLLAG